jgi:hypothetical protein
MATEIVQFREESVELEFLRSRGINPNRLARQAFEEALRQVRSQAKLEALRGLKFRLEKPAAKTIREDRDSH